MAYDRDVIAERIKYQIDTGGYSLARIAEFCEVQQYQTVSSWKNGNSLPSLEKMLKLCSLFKCDIGYFLGEHEEKTRPITDIKAETGLSSEAIIVLQVLRKNGSKDVLQLISDAINFEVHDPVVRKDDNVELLFQAVSMLLTALKEENNWEEFIQRAFYLCAQELFADFIKDQIRKPNSD